MSADVVPLVLRLVKLRHIILSGCASRRHRQEYYYLLLTLNTLGYVFLLEAGDTWEKAISSRP